MIIKKVDSLELLKGLKIKVYGNKYIMFQDVFKALLKRIMDDNEIDYKLSFTLKRKMLN